MSLTQGLSVTVLMLSKAKTVCALHRLWQARLCGMRKLEQ